MTSAYSRRMTRPRVLLAEDHPRVAEELRRVLEREFDVIAVVDDGNALLRAAGAADPDVIVTDIVMPGCDGIEATRLLVARHPAARVVLVTVHNDPELSERGYAAGALAYVLKVAAARDLVPAVRAALRGERYVAGQEPRRGIDPPGDAERKSSPAGDDHRNPGRRPRSNGARDR
jgi:DNA-binding NarL/FixJ family response regulator